MTALTKSKIDLAAPGGVVELDANERLILPALSGVAELILPAQLDDNPWQPRLAGQDTELRALSEDIKSHGLLNPPRVRSNPAKAGRYQVVSGHRRRDAWALAFPGVLMPVVVVELADIHAAQEAIRENMHRLALSPIERARALQRYIVEFKTTQEQAAPLFGLKTQASVSNALRLLDLPPAIQGRLSDGTIAESTARALLPLARLNDRKAIALVEEAAKRPADERGERIEQGLTDLLRDEGQDLRDAPWPADWPPEPIRLSKPQGDLVELPACKGCSFAIRRGGSTCCTRPVCFEAKLNHFANTEAARVSVAKGIALAAGGEKTAALYPVKGRGYNSWEDRRKAEKLLEVKEARQWLRVFPAPKNGEHYELKQLLGSPVVGLATANASACTRLLTQLSLPKSEQQKTAKPVGPAEQERQKAKEEAAETARRKERSKALRAKHDVSWLVANTARLIGERIHASGGVLDLVNDELGMRPGMEYDLIGGRFDELEDQLEKAKGRERDALNRELLALAFVCEIDSLPSYKARYEFDAVRGDLLELAESSFGIKLPAKWNEPPIHRTDFNCWHCGAFASGERITKRDQAEGWLATVKDKQTVDVRCPKCSKQKAEGKKQKAGKRGAAKK